MAWKYIVVRVGNQEVPIIFPEHLVHSLMMQAMKQYFVTTAMQVSPIDLPVPALKKLMEDIVPVSAGSVTLDVGKASGSSETLGVSARDEDTRFLQSYAYHGGYVELPESADDSLVQEVFGTDSDRKTSGESGS